MAIIERDLGSVKGPKGDKGDQGDSYVLTTEDKEEIAEKVADLSLQRNVPITITVIHDYSELPIWCTIKLKNYAGNVIDESPYQQGAYTFYAPPFFDYTIVIEADGYQTISPISISGLTKEGFSKEDHERLANLFKELDKKGVYCMLTNHNTELINELYKDYNIERVVKQLELQSVIDKKTSILSKGFKQRVSIAKAIVFNPKVLVLDEFSGGLDPAQIVSIRKLIQNIAKDCITILSTHHIEDALSLCTYIYIINQGHIVSSGTPQEITNNTHTANLEEAFLCLTKN